MECVHSGRCPRGSGQDGRLEPLLTEPRLVAPAATDPLADRSDLRLADLAGRILPDGTPADQGGLQPAPTTLGSMPQDLAQIFNLVELGSMIWFPPASLARRHPRPDIAYRTERAPGTPQRACAPARFRVRRRGGCRRGRGTAQGPVGVIGLRDRYPDTPAAWASFVHSGP
ncbi:hypothetical protein [Saccharothrix sp. ALI-22-I]|uniref:hypothetical protein n=1 Tax=Saccharothrix sp. ALI-22-I TaxID=1933778 RepID=UPI0015C3FAA3|nr:hypothetical protein [Saccharothrix sp. ALI-22-I]